MNWNIDPAHTTVNFVVRHLGITNVRGSFHNVTGSIETDESGAPTRISASIPAETVSTGNPDRDNHLKSAEFFDAQTFPALAFESSSVSKTADGVYDIAGTLSIHGVSQPVTLRTEVSAPIKHPFSGAQTIGAETSFELSRKEYGLTWNVALEAGGVMVSDKVKISLEIEASQQA